MAAINTYDGPHYQVLRRYLRTDGCDVPHIWIISAEYGLIRSDELIRPYDRRITPGRAAELAPVVADRFNELWSPDINRVLINFSADYELAFRYCLVRIHRSVHIERTVGGIGTRSGQLRRWLHTGSMAVTAC
jgi:hypothetical protein